MAEGARVGVAPPVSRAAGTARSRMREVAQLAGVAVSSVSRVLSGHPDVSPAMRERVTTAVEKLGYQPDILAQSMRLRATKSIGFVVGDISNPLLAQIVLGAETALRDAGYSMLLTNSENDPSLDANHIGLFAQRRVDGLLLSLASEEYPATISALEHFDAPIVLIDRELPGSVSASAVLSDHRTGMRAAVGHLLELGHRRIGLILGQPLRFSRERRLGLEDAYRERGLPPTYEIVDGQLHSAHGRRATRLLLDSEDPPTAIVAGGNQILVGTLEELVRRQLTLGEDISLVSCDSVALTELFQPPIAVVRRDERALGSRAAELLLRLLADENPDGPLTMPTAFVPRPSCGPPS
jgi:LacI family transcriptional regulator